MIGHLPGEVLREVADLARESRWAYPDLLALPHGERRMWLATFAATAPPSGGPTDEGGDPWSHPAR